MILVLGGSGHVGKAFGRCLQRRDIAYQSVSRRECNYYDSRQLDQLIRQTRSEFLINAAGFTGVPNVDACERQQHACLRANTILPAVVRDACRRHDLPWGHVSSGCIYQGDGPNGHGYSEEDQPNFCFERGNCSFYSGCKALAEQLLESAACCYIWRLRMPFSHHDGPRNYLSKLMRYERLLDVRNSLCHLDDFVEACIDCWQLRADYGTYNLTNPGSVTTREVVEMIHHSGLVERDFAFFASEAEFMRTAARAPRSSCVLDTTKARLAGLKMPHVVDALQNALERWRWEEQPAILRLPQHAALQSRAA